MRLSTQDISIIKVNILKYISDAKILLFGSRLYDDKKGGDIDILVETNNIVSLRDKIKILTNIELNGVLRKVDLVIKSPASGDQSIIATALKEGIVL